jgi:alpha-1,2-mannosyltransferase
MLICSPISWSHHWVWAVPVALALWERHRWAGAAWTAVFVTRPIVWPPYGQNREFGWSPPDHLVGNAYLLAALALSIWAAATLNRRVRSSACRATASDVPTSRGHAGARAR